LNVLTLKCPSCAEALHYNKVSERFECISCKISLDPLQDVFSLLDRNLSIETSNLAEIMF